MQQRDPQMVCYEQMATGRYARTARLIDTALELGRRGCAGGECDIGDPCRRHRLSLQVAERLERMRGKR